MKSGNGALGSPGAGSSGCAKDESKAPAVHYRRLFDACPDTRFFLAGEGRILDINPAGVALFGFDSREEMLRLPSASCLYCTSEDQELLRIKMDREGGVRDFPVEMKRKDGSRFIASITANRWVEDDGSVCYQGILRDLSELRKWQSALIESEKDRIRLTQSEEYNRELNKYILQILMMMSHDIRGPLVAMAATLKLLMRGTYGEMDQSVANTIKDLLSRVAQLLGIAEDYLGKAHSAEGAMRFECERLDLRQDIIDPVLDEISNEIAERHVRIDNRLGAIPAGTIALNMSKIWLKAVFRNLFRNALKYGQPGGTIAFGFEDHGSHYRLNVYNSGSAVPEDQREKLFTEHGKLPNEQRENKESAGMGLYLIREIIRKHGGDMWYEGKPDGSDFIFTLIKETGNAQ